MVNSEKNIDNNIMNKTMKTTLSIYPAGYTHIYMRDMVEQAIGIIRKESNCITATSKPTYDGKTDPDYFTNADIKAQEHYREMIDRLFTGCGMIGEEDGLRIPCTIAGEDLCFVIDPLDGTKAFKREQQYGIGTMIALLRGNKIIAAFVGNINTGEIIGFGPDGPEVERIRFGCTRTLNALEAEKPEETYLQIGKAPDQYPEAMKAVLKRPEDGGIFKQINIMNGSIGTMTARLWCGEVGAMINEPAYTPWDFAPVHGINKALGLIYLRPNAQNKLEPYEPEMFHEVRKPTHAFEIITRPEYVEAIMKAYNH